MNCPVCKKEVNDKGVFKDVEYIGDVQRVIYEYNCKNPDCGVVFRKPGRVTS